MKRSWKWISAVLALLMMMTPLLVLAACAKQEEYNWKMKSDEGTINAYYSDNGKYGFILNIEGTGKLPDYAAYKETPWYVKNGRITEIRVSEGITAIGANAFSGVKVDYVIIPKSVKAIGENAFGEDVALYAYEDLTVAGQNTVLLYSETAPSVENTYWHFRDEKPVVWQTLKVLFIGNSFTFYSDIPLLFSQLSTSAGQSVAVESVTKGAWTLSKFADATDEQGKIVDEKLHAADDYDVVVLQDQSSRPLDNNSGFAAGVKAMCDKIRATQKNCKIYLYATWGYPELATSYKTTITEVEEQLRKAYEDVASQVNATGVCQVGAAFSKVYTENRDKINIYYEDNKHPSYAGAFLSACVHLATILDIDPRTASFIGDLDSDAATILKQAAYDVVHH